MILLEIFDKETLFQIKQKTIEVMVVAGPKLLTALITLVVGYYLIKLLMRLLQKSFVKWDIELSLAIFLISFCRLVLFAVLLIAVASTLGVATSSFVAVLGGMALAIGLALQGSLSNFAGGVLILIFKPFKVDDLIKSNNNEGVVEKIDILYTTIRTFDNKVVIMPNGQVANNDVTNYSKKDIRRVNLDIGISYGSDIKKAREVILAVFQQDLRILNEPEPSIKLDTLGDSSLNLKCRCWVKTDDFFEVYWDMLEACKEALDNANITIPFPQRDVHFYNHSMEKKEIEE